MGYKVKLSDIGLPDGLQEVSFCKGEVDKITKSGAFVVKSTADLNEDNSVKNLEIDYWYRLPSNDAPLSPRSLIKLQTNQKGELTKFEVAGREVNIKVKEAVDIALQAIRLIHKDLKNNKLPEVAQILQYCDIHRAVGENIKIAGMKSEGGFDFKKYYNKETAEQDNRALALPSDPMMVKALFGWHTNKMHPYSAMQENTTMNVPATHVPTLKTYENNISSESDGDDFTIKASITPTSEKDNEPTYYPKLVDVFLKASRDEEDNITGYTLDKIFLANIDFSKANNSEIMQAVGSINGIITAASDHTAPVPLKSLADYNLLGLATSKSFLKGQQGSEFKFHVVSEYGNSLRNVHGDFGGGLGACKRVMAGGVIGMHDFPFEPSKDGTELSGAIPNASDWINDLDFLTLTHRHIDHMGGVPYENFAGKTIMVTPQDFEFLKRQMRTVHGAKANQKLREIDFVILDKPGAKTFSKDGGKSGVTVIYTPNQSPHSAYCTPYYYAAFYTDKEGKKQIKGVYANLGDLRDEDNVNDYFFRKGWRQLLKGQHDDLDLKDIPLKPTLCDWDSTSVRYTGITPTKKAVTEDMKQAVAWAEGYTVLNTHLASSSNMFEIMLHTASYHRRDFMAWGKNFEDTQSIQNIFGFDDLDRPWPKGHQNQIFMDRIYKQYLNEEIVELEQDVVSNDDVVDVAYDYFHQIYSDILDKNRTDAEMAIEAEKVRDLHNGNRLDAFYRYSRLIDQRNKILDKGGDDYEAKAYAKEVEAETYLLYLMMNWHEDHERPESKRYYQLLLQNDLHETLADYTNNFHRFNKRDEFAHRFEVDPHDLGGICITRATDTSLKMFAKYPHKLYLAITGSQGNEAEVESQLYKILENRALLHGTDPEFRHTARPLDKENVVLFNTQSTIPGNEVPRSRLIKKAVKEHRFITFNATQEGFELYNADNFGEERRQQIEDDLRKLNILYKKKDVQSQIIVPSAMAIGYKGHGRFDDLVSWMERVKAEVNASQHVNDPEAARKVEIAANMLHQDSMPLVEDGILLEIDRFSEEKVMQRGKIPRGIKEIRNDHPQRKPYKQIIHTQGYKVLDPEGCASFLEPLLAGASSSITVSEIFGLTADAELETRVAKAGKRRPSDRPAAVELRDGSGDEWSQRSPVMGPAVPGTPRWKNDCEVD